MGKVLFTVPGLGVSLHGFSLMFLLACFGALFLTAWRAERERIDPDSVFDLAVWLMGGGFIGARAFYLAQHPWVVHDVWDLFKFWQGGIVFYGCIIGGLAGSVICWYRRPYPFRPMADAVAPALALGLALGRIGCFLNGCCYGGISHLPWAVTFPAGTLPWLHHVEAGLISASAARSLPVHPTQLYAALDGLTLLGLLTAYYPRRRRDGEVLALLMVTYPVLRFFEESLRVDEGAFFAGLTISQNISVVLFCGGLLFWAYLWRRPVGRFADAIASRAGVKTKAEGEVVVSGQIPLGSRV